jgi:outer membrane protein TolC
MMNYSKAVFFACMGFTCLASGTVGSSQALPTTQARPAQPQAKSVQTHAAPTGTLAYQAPATQPLRISLADAIRRAKAISPVLATAEATARIAAETAVQARAANLPNALGNGQYLYTQGNGTLASRFIANNGVHEYLAQVNVHQNVSPPLFLTYRSDAILAAAAKDKAEIASRGVVVAVVQAYATLVAANENLVSARGILKAAQQFLSITRKRENNGAAAHADVVKARIQVADDQVNLQNMQLAQEQARIALGLLIFRRSNRNYTVTDDPARILRLPAFLQARQEAAANDPQVDAAAKTVKAAHKALNAARFGYLPTLSFDYYFGIDANAFAMQTTQPDGSRIQNLGYAASASLSVPLFTWGATHSKVKAAQYKQQAAKSALSYARRLHTGDLELFYEQAKMAQQEIQIRTQSTADALESRKLTLARYKAGLATALEVVNAESTVGVERDALYTAETNYATALANLATLTGNL